MEKVQNFKQNLPPEVQRLADEKFELLKQDPAHPSLNFKHDEYMKRI